MLELGFLWEESEVGKLWIEGDLKLIIENE